MDCADANPPEAGTLPELDALLAGTLALLTAWADPCPRARLPAPDLRQVMAHAHAHWQQLAQPAGATTAAAADSPVLP